MTVKKKPMIIMLICVGILFGGIFIWKTFVNFMMHRFISSMENISTVSAMKADYSTWITQKKYYGTARAIQGVNVTTELPGLVEKIVFVPGSMVKQGDLLVQLNISTDVAQLHALQANLALAMTTLKRDTAQYAIQAISKATLDTDVANAKNLSAQVAQQQALIDKKTIRAPFSGRIGIALINPGQYLSAGGAIASLQKLDKLYFDFYVPQQEIMDLKLGQASELSLDAYPNVVFHGKITAINPSADNSTRNVLVEATYDNPGDRLLPGMFAAAEVKTGLPKNFITLPETSISFNPYGNAVFKLTPKGKNKEGQDVYIASQSFVILGETRGDQVSVLKGVEKGDLIVTSGQLKLKNGSKVIINNSVVPKDEIAPNPKNE